MNHKTSYYLYFSAVKEFANLMKQYGELTDLGDHWWYLECDSQEDRDAAQKLYRENA